MSGFSVLYMCFFSLMPMCPCPIPGGKRADGLGMRQFGNPRPNKQRMKSLETKPFVRGLMIHSRVKISYHNSREVGIA